MLRGGPYSMHVQWIYSEVIRVHGDGVEHLLEGDLLATLYQDHAVRLRLVRVLDESKQMFLIHAGCCVDVSVHLGGDENQTRCRCCSLWQDTCHLQYLICLHLTTLQLQPTVWKPLRLDNLLMPQVFQYLNFEENILIHWIQLILSEREWTPTLPNRTNVQCFPEANKLAFSFLQHLLDPGHLDHPAHVGGVEFMLDEPRGQILPLVSGAAIDGQTGLRMLVLALFKIMSHFLSEETNNRKSLMFHDKV